MDTTAPVDARQNELVLLQREYRHMEINRRAYAEESQALLRKQQTTIEKLRKDNDAIKADISLIMRNSNRPLSSAQQDILNKLHDDCDKYASSIESENRNIGTMQEQIQIMKQKVLHQRKAMGGINASKENHYMIQKQIRILENRLDKSLIKFNEAIAINKTLRDTIDDLRRERVVFENIYKKMERELQERKQQMAEIIEMSNQSYEQRDFYQMEVAAIEQANRKEQEEFDEQTTELSRMLDNELRLPANNATGKFSKSGGGTKKALTGTAGNNTLMSGGDNNKSGTWSGTAGAGGGDPHSFERVQNFEEAFNKIKAATGITDIEELVRTFIKNEDHNFSLFNYVNEQNNEIEKLEENIQSLKEEEKKFSHESGEDVHQHKQILRELESKVADTESMAEKYEMRCQDLQRIIESLKRGIQSIFDKLEVDDSMSGGAADVVITESNMVHYLGLVEQKANLTLTEYAEVREVLMHPPSPVKDMGKTGNMELSASMKSLVSVLGTGPKVQRGQDHLHVNPPKLDDYQSDDEDDEDDGEMRPLTRDELKLRTMNRLQRRGGNNAQGASSGGGGGKKVAGKSNVR